MDFRFSLEAMSLSFVSIPGLKVCVENVMLVPGLETPSDKPFAFVYFLTIDNGSEQTVTVKGRKWIVTEENGESVVVEGPGVVGETPTLSPGGNFSYNSCHVIATTAEAKGSLFGVTESGEFFRVEIPDFKMTPPNS